MRVPIVLLITCAILLMAVNVCAVQVLVNGDFEGGATGGVPNGWTRATGTAYSCSGYTADWNLFSSGLNNYPPLDVYAGGNSLGIYRTDAVRCPTSGPGLEFYEWSILYQNIAVNPSTTYYVHAAAAAFVHHDRMLDTEDFWGAGIGLRICPGSGVIGSDRSDDANVVWRHSFWPVEGDSFWLYYPELTNQKLAAGTVTLPNSFTTGPTQTSITFSIVWFVKWNSEIDLCALDNVQLDLRTVGPAPPGSGSFTAKDPATWADPDPVWEPTNKPPDWSKPGATSGGAQFHQSGEYTLGMMPRNSAAADFNSDGLLDLAAACEWSHLVSVLLQQPDGGFAPALNLTGAVQPRCVQAGQIVGGPATDLIVTSAGKREVLVITGNGDGTFGARYQVPVSMIPWWVVLADFDNNGAADFAVSGQQPGTNGWVDVYLGDGSGGFTHSYTITGIADPSCIVATDLGGRAAPYLPDGVPDLAMLSWWGPTYVYAGNGDGTFDYVTTIVGQGAWKSTAMCAANFDEDPDDIPDLCVTYMWESDYAQFLQGLGDCEFYDQLRDFWIRPGRFPSGVDAIDFNGDGRPDVAMSNYGSADAVLYRNLGYLSDWNFGYAGHYGVGMANTHLLARDMDADGYADMVTTGGGCQTVNVIRCGPAGTVYAPVTQHAPAKCIATGDFVTADPRLDTAAADTAVRVFRNDGDLSFTEVYSLDPMPTGTFVDLGAADFNSDGKGDVTGLRRMSSGGAYLYVLLGNGIGGFTPGVYQASGANEPQDLAIADFDNASGQDIVVTESQATFEGVYCRLNTGTGTFGIASSKKKTALPLDSAPRDLDVADFNDDGKSDVVVALSAQGKFALMTGKGDGFFNLPVYFNTGLEPTGICAADLNNDLKTDVVVTNKAANTISVLLGSGAGSFGTPTSIGVGSQPSRVLAHDFDQDGKTDLVVSNSREQTVCHLKGNGDGTFAGPRYFRALGSANRLAAADLRGIGVSDLFVGAGYCEIFRNAQVAGVGITVGDDGVAQSHSDRISGQWIGATSPARSIVRYGWAVSTTPDTGGIVAGGEWRYTTATSATRSIALTPGQTYYILAQAEDSAALRSPLTATDGIRVEAPASVDTPAQAKLLADGAGLVLAGTVVSRVWPGSPWTCYVQDVDRASGVQVQGTGTAPAAGARVTVTGAMSSSGFERMVAASDVSVTGVPGEPAALGLTGKALGGGGFSYDPGPPASGQQGVLDGAGVNNVGLLVRIAGHVTRSQTGETFFCVDDGSGLADASGAAGVRCLAGTLSKPTTPGFAIVTGVSGIADIGGQPVRCVRVQRQTDIVQLW